MHRIEEPIPEDKPGLRQLAVRRRQQLDMNAFSETLCNRLRELPEFVAAQRVLLYLAMPGEVNVEGLLDEPKSWFVPRCAPKRRLAVHPFTPGETVLRAGPFGIREPDPALVPEADIASLDLVIVPGLLFSRSGERVGYGGGYYDRLLPRLRPDCLRVGVMPDALVLPSLPHDPWDIPLDIVVTESQIFRTIRGERL